MIPKATAMGNWQLATLAQQHAPSHIMSQAEFFDETSNHPGDSVPLIAQMQHPESSGFSPKLKSPLTVNEIQENNDRAADGD